MPGSPIAKCTSPLPISVRRRGVRWCDGMVMTPERRPQCEVRTGPPRKVHLRELAAQHQDFDPGDYPVAAPRYEPAGRPVAQTAHRLVD